MRLCFFLLQLFFFTCFVQKAKCQGAENGCVPGYSCLARRLCRPMLQVEKLLNARPKACGRGKVCCPKLENNENCGLEGSVGFLPDPPICPPNMYCINRNISDDKYPWLVALKEDRRRGYQCTGFLVDQRHVITSAKCFTKSTFNDQPETIYASIGSNDYREGRRYNITRILKHEDFKDGLFFNDIALLSLSEQVESSHFNPVCLPPKSLGDLVDHPGRVVGWGPTYPAHEMNIRIISLAECEKTLSTWGWSWYGIGFGDDGINNNVLCIDPIRMIHIDGPLMVKIGERWTVVGIFNGLPRYWSNADPYPQIYVRITEFLDWIKKSIDAM